MKDVAYGRDAIRSLRRHGNMAGRIRAAILEYAADSRAHVDNVTQLVGSPAKRLRVGDFRVVFDETETTITVTKAGPRGDVYD